MKMRTAEFVSPGHPDKVCDVIADTVLDAYLAGDPKSRVAVEVMGGHRHLTLSGEVTSACAVDVPALVARVAPGHAVHRYFSVQSPSIAQGVDAGGAGDQGIMTGYATRETEALMPLEYELARKLCRDIYARYPFDGKTQVTVADGRVTAVVASFQNAPSGELLPLVRLLIAADEYLVNPAGDWTLGGFDADSGLSGRKIVVDNYGPEVGAGGGSFSGKDYTKVDRSGAYMARRIAVDELRKHMGGGGAGHADADADAAVFAVRAKLAYAIGKAEPVMAVAELLDERGGVLRAVPVTGYDLSPAGIRSFLRLDAVRWADTAAWGHFGRGFSWG